ncbi:MAG: nuclear transport factor 2 family protein [Betaproteobacteria bacterium]|nr:nuclear transport factor 2 family protein [Betaproteobacteria bacterium]
MSRKPSYPASRVTARLPAHARMDPVSLASAQDAEKAFYRAFAAQDLEAMMMIWADDDDIVCVHPMGARLQGRTAVLEGWSRLFGEDSALRFEIQPVQAFEEGLLSVRLVHEHILTAHASRARPPVIATNVYRLTPRGWRMILHHASPSPANARMLAGPAAPFYH